jgi:hypothetical protein
MKRLFSFSERKPLPQIQKKWAEALLYTQDFKNDTSQYRHPTYTINKSYKTIKLLRDRVRMPNMNMAVAISRINQGRFTSNISDKTLSNSISLFHKSIIHLCVHLPLTLPKNHN